MANKRPKPEEIVSNFLRSVEASLDVAANLDPISIIVLSIPLTKYGGMGVDQLKELKRLQKENERLRRAVSDLTLDKLILKEAEKGNF